MIRLKQLYYAIDEYIENNIDELNDSMTSPDVFKYCLVNGPNGYNRGKILDVFYGSEIELKVFLVDTGSTETFDIKNVQDIPDDLIQMLPFQVHRLYFLIKYLFRNIHLISEKKNVI